MNLHLFDAFLRKNKDLRRKKRRSAPKIELLIVRGSLQ